MARTLADAACKNGRFLPKTHFLIRPVDDSDFAKHTKNLPSKCADFKERSIDCGAQLFC